jgi:hypothetical protein
VRHRFLPQDGESEVVVVEAERPAVLPSKLARCLDPEASWDKVRAPSSSSYFLLLLFKL